MNKRPSFHRSRTQGRPPRRLNDLTPDSLNTNRGNPHADRDAAPGRSGLLT